MARRSSPDRIYAARRAAVLSWLTQERRLSAERAEAVVAAWELEGDARGLDRMAAAFWDDGTVWITEQLGFFVRTPPKMCVGGGTSCLEGVG